MEENGSGRRGSFKDIRLTGSVRVQVGSTTPATTPTNQPESQVSPEAFKFGAAATPGNTPTEQPLGGKKSSGYRSAVSPADGRKLLTRKSSGYVATRSPARTPTEKPLGRKGSGYIGSVSPVRSPEASPLGRKGSGFIPRVGSGQASPNASPKGWFKGSPKRGEKSAVKVMVRIRPFNSRELAGLDADEFPTSILHFEGKKVTVLDKNSAPLDNFEFHETFWSIPEYQKQYGVMKPFADQEFIYDFTGKPAVETALSAKHCCVFAYGQTGTGKSYSMLGSVHDPGIAPRIVDHLFDELEEMGGKKEGWEYSVEVSFMEIYNEKVKDLLDDPSTVGFSPNASPGGSPAPRGTGGNSAPRKGSAFEGRRPSGVPGQRRGSLVPGAEGSPGSPGGARRLSANIGSPVGGRRLSADPDGSPALKGRRGSNYPAEAGSPLGSPALRRRGSMFVKEDAEAYRDLKVRQSPEIGVFVEGLSRLGKEDGVCDAATVKAVMRRGMEARATAETQMNATSSRSHAIFQICLRMSNPTEGKRRYSHLNLVDLAGSERITMSGATGQTLVEATRINLSLSTLRRVIDILVENQSKKVKGVPPFRESLLTWVLSESLGGNSETMMIATVSPAEENREDTINTLRYAAKAKKIENVVRVNEGKTNIHMGAMQAEMARLRAELQAQDDGTSDGAAFRLLEEERLRALGMGEEAAEKAARERAEVLLRQEELLRNEILRAQLESEHRGLQEENIEEKYEDEAEKVRLLELEHAQVEQDWKTKKRDAGEKERLAESLELQRAELAQLRALTEKRKRIAEGEANLLRRKQFALAFNKAFRKRTDASDLTELAAFVRKQKDTGNLSDIELQAMSSRARELHMSNSFLDGKITSLQMQEEEMLRNHDETVKAKADEISRTRRERLVAETEYMRKIGEHDTTTKHHRSMQRDAEATRAQQLAKQSAKQEKVAQAQVKADKAEETYRGLDAQVKEVVGKNRVSSTKLRQDTEHVKDLLATVVKRTEESARADEKNAEMRAEKLRIKERLAQLERECDTLRHERASRAELLEERHAEHDKLKRYVSGRYFASGSAHAHPPKFAEDRPPSPTREYSAEIRDRVWQGAGYVSAEQGRSSSPGRRASTGDRIVMGRNASDTSHRCTTPPGAAAKTSHRESSHRESPPLPPHRSSQRRVPAVPAAPAAPARVSSSRRSKS
eukprot:Hpha_TRINITY_DN15152_c3_g13::TRINITY_DN15152_c3_g13_i2::g.127290::m.127290